MTADPSIHFVGMTTIDMVQVADVLPEPDRKGWAHHAYLDVGGPAANAAITASILGSPVSLHSTFWGRCNGWPARESVCPI